MKKNKPRKPQLPRSPVPKPTRPHVTTKDKVKHKKTVAQEADEDADDLSDFCYEYD